MDWVKRIDIKREKINPNIRPILVLFKCATLDEKYRMLKSMDDLISKFIKYLEDNNNSNLLLTILTFILRCFALKVIFSLSDRYKILTND